MVHVIEDLMDRKVDLDFAQVPTTVDLKEEGIRQVVASAFVPNKVGYLPAHLVVFYRGNDNTPDGVLPDDKHWAVSLLIHDDDQQKTYLANGDYDMTFAEAVATFVRRVERQG